MGLLVEGKWVDQWYDTAETGGRIVRTDPQFRNWITPDGEPGPSGEGGFEAQAGRYHLYVSLACPWAHRTLIFRALKSLEDIPLRNLPARAGRLQRQGNRTIALGLAARSGSK